MLLILDRYRLADLGYGSAQALHYQIEAMRHAYVDRNQPLSDPAFVKSPLDRFLDLKYAQSIRTAIDPKRAGDSSKISRAMRRTKAATRRITPSRVQRATQFRWHTR